MHDSRKTLLNVLIDNLFNVFNITTVILFVIFIINKSFLYLIPLTLSLMASIFSLVLDLKHYVLKPNDYQRMNVIIDGKEHEDSYSNLKVGSLVALYPNETINFVGEVKSGILFVDESPINGIKKIVRKQQGSPVVKGSIVVEGHGVVEVKELRRRFGKLTLVKQTKLTSRIKLLNLLFSFITLLVLVFAFIFDKLDINNVSKCAIASLPCLVNVILTIYLFVLSKQPKKDIKIFDHTFLSELSDIDVVCLDKTGTLTTGEYEIFKTIVLAQSSFTSISLDTNRAFDQVVSNIIKTTQEKGGYYSVLQKNFYYEVSKIIDAQSSINENGLYSAITVRGGSTYALGEVSNFELNNYESASSIISEYESAGYHVLLLTESKNPLKQGLIDGKCTAIGLIVLQETIRESAIDLIKFCLEKGKQVKVISGDRIATVSEITRKAGLENLNRATSVKLVPVEKIGLLVEGDVVFADATPSQKAFIVKELQKNGHRVAFIGDGDNDTQALKAANVAISLSSGTDSAIKCSHACVDKSFNLTESFINESKSFKNKMDNVVSILYSQVAFSCFYLLAFLIAKSINNAIYNPFEYNHLFVWTIFGIIAPVVVLLVDKNENITQKSFLRNFIASSLLLIVPVGILYILQLMQFNGVGFFALPSDANDLHETLITSQVVNNLSYLLLALLSLVIAYSHFTQFNRSKGIGFAAIVIFPVAYAILLALDINSLSPITQIDTQIITPVNYFVTGIIALGCSALYLLVLDIISIVKGENQNVKSKSKD